FKWMFSRIRVKDHVFQRELEDLKRITGLWNSLDFNLPEEKLGFVKLEFDGMISSIGTQNLLTKSDLKLNAEDKIEQFFQNESNPSKVCKIRKNIDFCKELILKTTSKALRKMAIKISEMKKLAANKNWKEFTESYAELGQAALTNQFSFQTFLELIGKDNFKMEFKGSGEKVKTFYIHKFSQDLI
ncbi:MAG: hypothetical protein ACHQYQ_11500, partial [Bacteriovoracales bacterium]